MAAARCLRPCEWDRAVGAHSLFEAFVDCVGIGGSSLRRLLHQPKDELGHVVRNVFAPRAALNLAVFSLSGRLELTEAFADNHRHRRLQVVRGDEASHRQPQYVVAAGENFGRNPVPFPSDNE